MIRTIFEKLIPSHKPTWWERYSILLLALGTIIFMVISLAIGLHQSVWFDEAYSILLAKQPPAQLVHLTSLDTHPPLYYLLLKGWAGIFGWSELALRSLSVIAAGLAVFVGGLFVRRVFGIRAALVTLPFIVFSPFLLRYGFEIRMYSLASLIGILATYVLVIALQTKPGRYQWLLYGLYGVLVALGVYTLYYIALLWITHLIWLIWLARRQKQPIMSSAWVRAFALSVILFLPWLPAFVSQVGNGALAAIAQPLTIDNLAGIVSFAFVYQPAWQLSGLVSLLVLFVIIAVTIFTKRAFKIVTEKQRPYLILLVMYFLVPISFIALVSLIRPLYVERYLSQVILGGYLFVGVIIWLNLKRASKKVCYVAVGLFITMLVGVAQLAQVGNFNFQRLQSPMIKQAAQTMAECSKGTTIFAADPYVATELSYYLPSCQINFYSDTSVLKGGYAPLSNSPLRVADPARELSLSRKIYYVYYDQQKSAMPSELHQSAIASYSGLTVATYSEE